LTVFKLKIEEPLTGEALHKAIVLDRKSDVEKILESEDGPRVVEIPDKFGNLPLMIAVNRNNLE
jgi:ankyrin repeat protein